MTVADLVSDTCEVATKLTQRGDNITVLNGEEPLFRIVPVEKKNTNAATGEIDLTPEEYAEFLKDLDELAKIPPEQNGVLKMRARRLRQ